MAFTHNRIPGYCRWLAAATRAILLVVVWLGAWLAPAAAQEPTPVEYQVKAAFLLNFAKFTQWPGTAFENNRAPITVCIFRYDPFGRALDEIMRGKNVDNREVVVRRFTEVQQLSSCQLIFVSDRETRRLPEILAGLKGGSFLVIGETAAFAERGGGIQFFLEDNRLRFAVNLDALARSRLTVSSKLLALARIVHDQSFPKGF
jgi:hypothetical protein